MTTIRRTRHLDSAPVLHQKFSDAIDQLKVVCVALPDRTLHIRSTATGQLEVRTDAHDWKSATWPSFIQDHSVRGGVFFRMESGGFPYVCDRLLSLTSFAPRKV